MAVAATVLIAVLRGRGDPGYAGRIAAHRARIERDLRVAASPLGEAARSALGRLDYYAADPSWRVAARIVPILGAQTAAVETTGGGADIYLRHSWAELTLAGRAHRLLLLRSPGDASNRLFLAFRDATSGSETYAGGRYLDLYAQAGDSVTIDFNLAYNPYCVYDAGYSCPLAPPENTVDIAVRAGEKAYRGSPR